MRNKLLLTLLILAMTKHCFAQTIQSAELRSENATTTTTVQTYPKIVGYLSFILPLVTANKSTTTNDFSNNLNNFAIGFPIGVNILYSKRFGFSYVITPTIKTAPGSSKTSNILFDPGTMFRFNHGFTIISRLAFETGGRYGFTPVFNQIVARSKAVNYFVAMSLPARFGDSAPASLGLSLQVGFIFN